MSAEKDKSSCKDKTQDTYDRLNHFWPLQKSVCNFLQDCLGKERKTKWPDPERCRYVIDEEGVWEKTDLIEDLLSDWSIFHTDIFDNHTSFFDELDDVIWGKSLALVKKLHPDIDEENLQQWADVKIQEISLGVMGDILQFKWSDRVLKNSLPPFPKPFEPTIENVIFILENWHCPFRSIHLTFEVDKAFTKRRP